MHNPDPPPQVGNRKPHPEADRIRAAMMTIAAHQPRIDPRLADREAREAEQERGAALDRQRQRSEDLDTSALNTASPSSSGPKTPRATRTAPSTLPCSPVLDDLTLHGMRVSIDPPREDLDDDRFAVPEDEGCLRANDVGKASSWSPLHRPCVARTLRILWVNN